MPSLLAVLLAVGLAAGLLTPAMDIDAAQYAAIALEMLQRGDWLTVTERGAPYLDKPPLVFWTAAASFAVFGASDWAYKLPSLVALAAAVWATGRLAGTLSGDDDTARLARWVLAASIGALLMVADPRTDTLLMAGVAFASWQGAAWLRGGRRSHLLWASVGVGIGMLAKGPMGLVAPGVVLLADLAAHGRWHRLRSPSLLLVPLVVAAMLAPMLVGLHRQFGTDGITFYFWTQSFGRVTGSNAWRNDAGAFFFVHTFLWTFLPWAPLVAWRLVRLARGRVATWRDDAAVAAGFVLLVAAISMSRYKLPHYVYVALPCAAVLAARELRDVGETLGRGWRWGIIGQGWLLTVLALGIGAWAFGPVPWWGVGVALFLAAASRRADAGEPWRTVRRAAAGMAAGALAFNAGLAPRVFAYQAESTAGRLVREADVPAGRFVALGHHRPSLDFAARRTVPDLPTRTAVDSALRASAAPLWVYAQRPAADSLRDELSARGVSVTDVAQLEKFGVSRLNGRFVNPATRGSTTEPWTLLRLSVARR